ncbi:unnamed protein product [Didymodactylos carnosus]|uniref:Uncharacterized protein n=1 Tax=Didymodactylos carnosus TaxID=1234261 RepID=A0A816A7R3_9BILA|nr:unnamed protein product [Didymodactylos carnosus]CAF1592544.1 unnamed protein product [Didymodactylos carnosus]CAF4314545.1 unnamed protein product [Didymodactylos carnosus]CAF4465375.1 unnamed protein product [Didymodactylos carnosus]
MKPSDITRAVELAAAPQGSTELHWAPLSSIGFLLALGAASTIYHWMVCKLTGSSAISRDNATRVKATAKTDFTNDLSRMDDKEEHVNRTLIRRGE